MNDDAMPTFSISSVSVKEGNSGTVTVAMNFTVTLSAASGKTATVYVATVNGTAVAGSDYFALPRTMLTFAPGETSKVVMVSARGDTTREPDETLTVQLTNPVNAGILIGLGTGTIKNDDK